MDKMSETMILKKRKSNKLLGGFYVFVFLILFLGAFFIFFKKDKIISSNEIKLSYYQTGNSYNNCKLVKAEGVQDTIEYSFDSGETWSKDNSKIICPTGKEMLVYARDINKKIVGESIIHIDKESSLIPLSIDGISSLSFSQDVYSCKVGEKIYLSVNSLPMNADGNLFVEANNENIVFQTIVPNCYNCTISDRFISIDCNKTGSTKLTAVTDNGISTSTIINIFGKSSIMSSNTISYEKKIYSCEIGEEINTIITTNNGIISSFSSNNSSIVSIASNPDYQLNCINCIAVKFKCLKAGGVTLNAESNYGAIGNTRVVVKSVDVGSITFDNSSYSCEAGKSIATTITASSSNGDSKVTSYASLDPSIATIEKHPTQTNKCINCVAVKINCIKSGETKLTAKSSSGATITSNIKVKSINSGTIAYDKESYSCTAGKTISAKITATSSSGIVKVANFKSLDTSIATIEKHPTETIKCINCVAVQINCIKSGEVKLSATSSSGVTTTSNLNVIAVNPGTIVYDKESYSCTAGDRITTKITATSSSGIVSVADFKSLDPSIATIEKHPTLAVNCINCVAVQINCIKSGEVKLAATSSSGATTTTNVIVNVESPGTIEYDEKSYTCTAGSKITTTITATSSSGIVSVANFKSLDPSIATIERHPTLAVNCINCIVVQINCIKTGEAKLTATSSTGATTTSNAFVIDSTILFTSNNYACDKGAVMSTFIKTYGYDKDGRPSSIAKIFSSDPSIATIERHPTLVVNCADCMYVQIKCLKYGKVVMTALSTSGIKGIAIVEVVPLRTN